MIPLSKKQLEDFETQNICHICDTIITENEVKVKDHCHSSGLYRGPAHSKCNLNFKLSK